MSEVKERLRRRRQLGRRGLGAISAAIVMAGVIAAVGVVSYVSLNSMNQVETSSSSIHSCTPPHAPQCQDHNSSASSYRVAPVLGLSRG
jgi:hypothetical protein